MQITKTNPSFSGRNYLISREANKGKTLLYNQVINIIEKNPVPCIIKNKGIEISVPNDSNNIKKVLDEFKRVGIKFERII